MSRSKPTIQVTVLAYLAEHGNGTAEEIAKKTGRARWSVYQRCYLLAREKVLSKAFDSGQLRFSLVGHPQAFVSPKPQQPAPKRREPAVRDARSLKEQALGNRSALELAWSLL